MPRKLTVNRLQRYLDYPAKRVDRTPFIYKPPPPPIRTGDGSIITVNAGDLCLHCKPRRNEPPYTHLEVSINHGAQPPAKWKRLTHSGRGAYAFVPVKWVAEYIDEHGGMHNPYTPRDDIHKRKQTRKRKIRAA